MQNASVLDIPSLEATERLARRFVPLLMVTDVLTLEGELGSGKTAFARALIRALGVEGSIPSPTFTLLETYETPQFLLHHFDLYRLKNESELDELGFQDMLCSGISVIEWPDRAKNQLPEDRLELLFEHHGDTRQCRVTAMGTWIERLLKVVP